MKQYKAIELKSQFYFIVKGINFKDCQKQIEAQLGYKPELQIVSSKRTH